MAVLPKEHFLINLDYISDTERTISLEPKGHRYNQLLKDINLDLSNENT
jgi:hypothetical protein